MTVISFSLAPTLRSQPLERPERYYQADAAHQLTADPARRIPVTFDSAGLQLAGHLYRPRQAYENDPTPAIVMCGPASSVKEQTLPHYAERLSDAGYTVLTFDSRTYGESEGEPRCYYDPAQIIDDYSNAVSYLLTRDDVDSDQIALVGVCMGGGYALSTGARDKRVRAVVSVAGGYDIGGTFHASFGADGYAEFIRQINDIVTLEYQQGGSTHYIPAIARDLSGGLAFMPNPEAYSYYDRTSQSDAPTWSNQVAIRSLQSYFSYNAVAAAPLVAPTPLLIVHGTHDLFLWPEFAQRAYDAASGDKQIVWLETHNHIELYDQDPYVSEATGHIVNWLDSRLKH